MLCHSAQGLLLCQQETPCSSVDSLSSGQQHSPCLSDSTDSYASSHDEQLGHERPRRGENSLFQDERPPVYKRFVDDVDERSYARPTEYSRGEILSFRRRLAVCKHHPTGPPKGQHGHCKGDGLLATIPNGTIVANRIFVGGLSSSIDEADLYSLFSHFGRVRNTKIMGSKGYGFVTFHTTQEARALLLRCSTGCEQIYLKERKLNVAPAVKKERYSLSAEGGGDCGSSNRETSSAPYPLEVEGGQQQQQQQLVLQNCETPCSTHPVSNGGPPCMLQSALYSSGQPLPLMIALPPTSSQPIIYLPVVQIDNIGQLIGQQPAALIASSTSSTPLSATLSQHNLAILNNSGNSSNGNGNESAPLNCGTPYPSALLLPPPPCPSPPAAAAASGAVVANYNNCLFATYVANSNGGGETSVLTSTPQSGAPKHAQTVGGGECHSETDILTETAAAGSEAVPHYVGSEPILCDQMVEEQRVADLDLHYWPPQSMSAVTINHVWQYQPVDHSSISQIVVGSQSATKFDECTDALPNADLLKSSAQKHRLANAERRHHHSAPACLHANSDRRNGCRRDRVGGRRRGPDLDFGHEMALFPSDFGLCHVCSPPHRAGGLLDKYLH